MVSPDELDTHSCSHGGDECGEGGHRPGEDADGDAGQGHVPDAVTDEGEPALHEEGADQRGREPDEHGGHEGLTHEVEGEQVTHGAPRGRGGGR